MDDNHPTILYLRILEVFTLGGLLIILSFCLSGDINKLNCNEYVNNVISTLNCSNLIYQEKNMSKMKSIRGDDTQPPIGGGKNEK